jgi:mRNA interferase MazF
VVILQGDVFWAELSPARGAEPMHKRPVVIVQRDSINRSKFQTILIVPLTSQTRHAHLPGNVLLKKGEAKLPKQSVARATHVMVIDKHRLQEKIGSLPKAKIRTIIDNIIFVLGGHVLEP